MSEEFGRYMATLREQRRDYWHPWTQEYLAKKAGLETHQIARIEQGKNSNLQPFLEPIALAFQLNEMEKIEFYAKAGYIYQPKQDQFEVNDVIPILENLKFPASIRNQVWDFIAFNSYHAALFGYTVDSIKRLSHHPIGANLLVVLFDERIKQLPDKTDDELKKDIMVFRSTSFRYIQHPRYNEIVAYMKQNFPKFDRLWHQIDEEKMQLDQFKIPTHKFKYPPDPESNTELEFLSLRIPKRYVGNDYVSIYTPLSNSDYQSFVDYADKLFTESYYLFEKTKMLD